jgi:hypothetical protein
MTYPAHGNWSQQIPETSGLVCPRLGTHQHWSPADANCYQSLLLDPDATIGNDLHKRLFLLISGRRELPSGFSLPWMRSTD